MRVGPENDGNCNYGISKSCPTFTSVRTAAQAFPFSELRWENFEKLCLCYRLVGKQADIESHSLYGRAGQAQQGIDIFARKRNGR